MTKFTTLQTSQEAALTKQVNTSQEKFLSNQKDYQQQTNAKIAAIQNLMDDKLQAIQEVCNFNSKHKKIIPLI